MYFFLLFFLCLASPCWANDCSFEVDAEGNVVENGTPESAPVPNGNFFIFQIEPKNESGVCPQGPSPASMRQTVTGYLAWHWHIFYSDDSGASDIRHFYGLSDNKDFDPLKQDPHKLVYFHASEKQHKELTKHMKKQVRIVWQPYGEGDINDSQCAVLREIQSFDIL